MADYPNALNTPPEINGAEKWKVGFDPARRIAYSRHRHKLPKITSGGKTFVFPVGIEGFKRSGSATLGIHKYLGRAYVDVHVIHRDEARIELTGLFPGLTATKNMQDLINVLIAPGPKFLHAPGVFPHIQTCYVENYDCQHVADDQTHSIEYVIMFVRTTTGARVDDKNTILHSQMNQQPSNEKGANVKSQSDRVVTVTDSMRTLRGIADHVYGDPDMWTILVKLNANELAKYNTNTLLSPTYSIALMRLKVGTRLRY